MFIKYILYQEPVTFSYMNSSSTVSPHKPSPLITDAKSKHLSPRSSSRPASAGLHPKPILPGVSKAQHAAVPAHPSAHTQPVFHITRPHMPILNPMQPTETKTSGMCMFFDPMMAIVMRPCDKTQTNRWWVQKETFCHMGRFVPDIRNNPGFKIACKDDM